MTHTLLDTPMKYVNQDLRKPLILKAQLKCNIALDDIHKYILMWIAQDTGV